MGRVFVQVVGLIGIFITVGVRCFLHWPGKQEKEREREEGKTNVQGGKIDMIPPRKISCSTFSPMALTKMETFVGFLKRVCSCWHLMWFPSVLQMDDFLFLCVSFSYTQFLKHCFSSYLWKMLMWQLWNVNKDDKCHSFFFFLSLLHFRKPLLFSRKKNKLFVKYNLVECIMCLKISILNVKSRNVFIFIFVVN